MNGNKKKRKYRKEYNRGEITKAILKGLVIGGVTVGAVVAVAALPGIAPVLRLFQGSDYRKRQKFKNGLYRMKKQKLIKMYYIDNEEVIEITEKGKKRLLQYDYDDMEINIPKKWDNMWRIVIFDIPEKRKKARNAINLKLKELGFHPIQKSTFIFPYKCKNEIDFVGEHFFVRKHINYIIAKYIDDGKKIKKFFNLT